ncbi:hypothetical protein COCON_G00207980 [Conger conger]|uniref:Uncharacterized protein n=1 Tax=Conger conger TaxID=82655 RepID=A0A9Q1D020_CONCO|nr:hypothetical protein COCON_G00207980 [Conger conger]
MRGVATAGSPCLTFKRNRQLLATPRRGRDRAATELPLPTPRKQPHLPCGANATPTALLRSPALNFHAL